MGLGPSKILLLLLIVVIIFGASKLPQIGEGMGKAIRNFKKSVDEDDEPEQPKKITKSKIKEENQEDA